MNRLQWIGVVLMALALMVVVAAPAGAQSPIEANLEVEDVYPDGIIFRLEAASSEGNITNARVIYRSVVGEHRQSAPFDFDPAPAIETEFHAGRTEGSFAPGEMIEYQVLIRDEEGNEFVSEPQQLTTYPPGFDWKELTVGDATFVWYEGSEAWAEEMAAMAAPAVDQAAEMFGAEVEAPVRIVAFPDSASFHQAMPYLNDWVGGITLADKGMTIQIISPDNDGWARIVIPHELAHLVFDLATQSMFAPVPNWLSEGLAMLNEPGDHAEDRALVERAAEEGELYRLSEMRSESFGDHTAVGLNYAQAWHMSAYLLETCGEDGLRTMIAELNAGRSLDDAMMAACGFDEATFYNQWYADVTGEPVVEGEVEILPSADEEIEAEEPSVDEEPVVEIDDEAGIEEAPLATRDAGPPMWLGPLLIIGGLALLAFGLMVIVLLTIALRRAA